MGLLPVYDPPRHDTAATITTAAGAMGVGVKMITGDAIAIGRETARQLGMNTDFVEPGQLSETKRQAVAAAGGTFVTIGGKPGAADDDNVVSTSVVNRRLVSPAGFQSTGTPSSRRYGPWGRW
jgi:magnesium-transporting ATPase (P-type)